MSTDLVQHEPQTREISVQTVLKNLNLIRQLMKDAMDIGLDYGAIPGTGGKPTLLKPGAEKLGKMFRLAPKFKTVKTYSPDGHLMVDCTCELFDIDDNYQGEANRTCTTRESKYAYRNGSRKCQQCGKEAIIKGKTEYAPRQHGRSGPVIPGFEKGGWVCFKKKDGCGASYPDEAPEILGQQVGRIPNPDLADSYNTVIAIAEKRAYVAAMRVVTASSALFDEEIPAGNEREPDHEEAPRQPARQDQPPQEDPAVKEAEGARQWVRDRLKEDPALADINDRIISDIKAMREIPRKAAWNELKRTMEANNYVVVMDEKGGRFVHRAEAEAEPIGF